MHANEFITPLQNSLENVNKQEINENTQKQNIIYMHKFNKNTNYGNNKNNNNKEVK